MLSLAPLTIVWLVAATVALLLATKRFLHPEQAPDGKNLTQVALMDRWGVALTGFTLVVGVLLVVLYALKLFSAARY